jgi:imidazole glycerol-phosphate synthase subunit HisH
MIKIAIIDYGAGNVQSVLFSLKRLGINAFVTNNHNAIKAADKVIFPGVGEAGNAMQKLSESGLDILIPTLKQPFLGICLGMQLLCNTSEEGNTRGLGVFNINIKRFSNEIKVPQIGWNNIYNLESPLFKDIPENEYMYLVHSYYAPICTETIAKANYGLEYASALQRNNFYGVQFHPEKSGKFGEQILSNFLKL